MAFFKQLQEIARPHWADILVVLKRTGGVSVAELAARLSLSYMGIKKHCNDLEKKGYLETWRRSKDVGRPEKIYRLGRKGQALFQQDGGELTLEILQSVDECYGPMSAERLLFKYFGKKTARYLKKIRGKSVLEKAEELARLRMEEGYLSECTFKPQEGLRLNEYHHPLSDLLKVYPSLARMETQMFEHVLGTQVERCEQNAPGGLLKYVYKIHTLGNSTDPDPLKEMVEASLVPA